MSGKINILCILGASGSGKTILMDKLIKHYSDVYDNVSGVKTFIKIPQVTTREKRENEDDDAYKFISEKEYDYLCSQNKLTARTTVVGKRYGAFLDVPNLRNRYNIDKTIFVIVVNASGLKSIKNFIKEDNENKYNLRNIIVRPHNNIPYTVRKNRNKEEISKEMIDLAEIKDATIIENIIPSNILAEAIELFKINKNDFIVLDNKKYYFKNAQYVVKELGDISDEWRKFLYIESDKKD